MLTSARKTMGELRRHVDARATPEQLREIMNWVEQAPDGQVGFVPVSMLGRYVGHYEKLGLPSHARISLDAGAIEKCYPGGFEIRLLEAALYENMCSLFNLTRREQSAIPPNEPSGAMTLKIARKNHGSLMRATVVSACHFVEGYVNCLATDYLAKHGDEVNDKDLILLTEWDAAKQRYRFVSTRDKLVQYPRIISHSSFPPLDENNCDELAFFVTVTKEFRDSITHASASFDIREQYPKKEQIFWSLSQETVDKVVDTSIALVRRVAKVVHDREPGWLHDRAQNGSFADEVFE